MTQAERFLADITAFLERSGMSATAFGKSAVGDPSFVPDLRAGRAPSLRMVERVEDYIRSQEATTP